LNTLLIIMGTWLISDCIYSISLYMNAPSYEGSKKQTWRRDHWVRLVRGIIGLSIILMVVINECLAT
jgi:hypothetical protein